MVRSVACASSSGQERAASPRTTREKRSICNAYWSTISNESVEVSKEPMLLSSPMKMWQARARECAYGKSKRSQPRSQDRELLVRRHCRTALGADRKGRVARAVIEQHGGQAVGTKVRVAIDGRHHARWCLPEHEVASADDVG